jgi:glucose/arabinose dehydrogenase
VTIRSLAFSVVCVVTAFGGLGAAQEQGRRPRLQVPPLGPGPFVFDTAEQHRIRVSVVARGLSHPWALAFLPDGNLLVTERPGRLRMIKSGVLDPTPVAGVPAVRAAGLGGLEDIALHPRFAENHFLYLTYIKPVNDQVGTPALARGRFENGKLSDVKDLVVTDPGPPGSSAVNSRIVFSGDGMLYMSAGGNIANMAQDPASLRGKMLRLRDDGSVPDDNPFVGKAGYRPEIYTLGHRNSLALIVHPVTGEVWNNENGPNGGDEINVIKSGRNYGWPVVSYGRDYPGPRISEHPTREGMESPLVTWIPSIAASGMAVYTGDRFPQWKGNVFVGSMRVGEIEGTGHLQRLVLNAKMEELRRESMLTELRQRIREVRQGPDGFLYLLTDEEDGALLRIEPAP